MNVGFLTYWFERGQAFITRELIDAIPDHEAFILARGGGVSATRSDGEWAYPNLSSCDQYAIPHDALLEWISTNNIGVMFFNEEYDFNLIKAAHDAGVKTVGIYYWELFNPAWAKIADQVFDAIICPTKCCFQKFRKLGMKNIHHIPWGIDLSEWKPVAERKPGPVRFFHPAGWGGMHARRGTQFVIDAFKKLNDPDAELLIHTQFELDHDEGDGITYMQGTVSRDEIRKMSLGYDVAILPSMWEGIGLTFLESLACGLPIITVDAPPMNEFVQDGYNGICVDGEIVWYDDVYVPGIHVNIDDLADAMKTLCDLEIVADMKTNAIEFSREHLGWSQNGREFKALIDNFASQYQIETSRAIQSVSALVEYEYDTQIDDRQYARYGKILADDALVGDVLEIGCKHGTLAFRLAVVVDVVGVDSNDDNIQIAIDEYGIGVEYKHSLAFRHAEIHSLPFHNDSFDTIIMSKVLEHIEHPEDLAEVVRVLKPTGTIIVVTNLGFAHWDPDHKWFFMPKETYDLLEHGWFFKAFPMDSRVVAFEDFIEEHFGLPFGYQVYDEHESEHDSLEIYAHIYGPEAKWSPFPELDGEEVWLQDNRCGIEPSIPFVFAEATQHEGAGDEYRSQRKDTRRSRKRKSGDVEIL